MEKDNSVVIVSAARTPFGRFKGSLYNFSAYELGAMEIEEVIIVRVNSEIKLNL